MNISVLSVMSGLVCASFHLASGLLIPISSKTISSVWSDCASFSGTTQALFILSGIMFSSHLKNSWSARKDSGLNQTFVC